MVRYQIPEPRLQPKAHPVDLFVLPSRTGPAFQTVADLSALSPTLALVGSMVQEKEAEEKRGQGIQTAEALYQEAAADRDTNREAWNKRVRELSELEGQNPYLIEHLQKLAARDVTGRYAAELESKIHEAAALRDENGKTVAMPNLSSLQAQAWGKYANEYVLTSKFGSDAAYEMKGRVDAHFMDAVARQRSRNNADENARLTGNELANEYIRLGRSGSLSAEELGESLVRSAAIQEEARASGTLDVYATNMKAIRTARRVIAQENPQRALEMGILLRGAMADPVTKKTIGDTPAALAELDQEDDHIRALAHDQRALIREDRAEARDDVIRRFRNENFNDMREWVIAGKSSEQIMALADLFIFTRMNSAERDEFRDEVKEYAGRLIGSFQQEAQRPARTMDANEKTIFEGVVNEILAGEDRSAFLGAIPDEQLDRARKDTLLALQGRVQDGRETLSKTTYDKDASDVRKPIEEIPLGRDGDTIMIRAEARSAVNSVEREFHAEALKRSMPTDDGKGGKLVPDPLAVQSWLETAKPKYVERSNKAIENVMLRYTQARSVDLPNDLDRSLERDIFRDLQDMHGGAKSPDWQVYTLNHPNLFDDISEKADAVRQLWKKDAPALIADKPLPSVLVERQRGLLRSKIADVLTGKVPTPGTPVAQAATSEIDKFVQAMSKATAEAAAEEKALPARQLKTAEMVYEVPPSVANRNKDAYTRSRVATWMREQSKVIPGDGGKAIAAIARGLAGGTRLFPWSMATPENPEEIFATAQRGARSILDAGPDSPQRFAAAQSALAVGGGLTPEMVEAGEGKVEILGSYRRDVDAIVESLKQRTQVYGLTSVSAREELPKYTSQLVPRTFPFVGKFDPWMTDFGFKSEAQLREWEQSGRLKNFIALPTIGLTEADMDRFIRYQVNRIKMRTAP